jgi:hypothetical protein
MPWTQRDLDWVAARLLPDLYDIKQRDKYNRVTRRLTNLYKELMKFRITEDTFFLHAPRKTGEIIEWPRGPWRSEMVGGKWKHTPLFEEIKTMADETPTTPMPPATFAEATATVIAPPKPATTQAKSTAALLSQLATRRVRLHDTIKTEIEIYAKRLADMETNAPAVFVKANTILDDEQSGFKDLEGSLEEFAGANGAPLEK